MNKREHPYLEPLPSPQGGEVTAWTTKHQKKNKMGRATHGPRPMLVWSPG